MRARTIKFWGVAAVVAFILAGCGPQVNTAAVEAVKKTMSHGDPNQRYYTGELNGGIAVLTSNHGAYWVRKGRVHAVNGRARRWSPGLPPPQYDMDYVGVRMAVNGPLEMEPLEPPEQE